MKTSGHNLRLIISFLIISTVLLTTILPFAASADNTTNRYYIGSTVNTGLDNGYSGKNPIISGDPHYGWELGKFFISGFSRVITEDDGTIIFLKTPGDEITLSYELMQNIDRLNNTDGLLISSDDGTYDAEFGVSTERRNFKRGTLIIRHTDYQNYTKSPVYYNDYLAGVSAGADTSTIFCEEGDYEVALDYEIDTSQWFLNINRWHNYRTTFKFSVRNGNCMVYPFDTITGAELTNTSITENGFYLDLARSRYLNIDIKKEVRVNGVGGLVEDVRFNKPAKDGEEYTDEGIYTITVSNPYTKQTTTKIIYVGTDKVLKAHVMSGLSISDIEYKLSLGATIDDFGNITMPEDNPAPPDIPSYDVPDTPEAPKTFFEQFGLVVIGAIGLLILAVIFIFCKIKSAKH